MKKVLIASALFAAVLVVLGTQQMPTNQMAYDSGAPPLIIQAQA